MRIIPNTLDRTTSPTIIINYQPTGGFQHCSIVDQSHVYVQTVGYIIFILLTIIIIGVIINMYIYIIVKSLLWSVNPCIYIYIYIYYTYLSIIFAKFDASFHQFSFSQVPSGCLCMKGYFGELKPSTSDSVALEDTM